MTSASGADFAALLDGAVDAIILIDHEGTVEIFNQAAERLFGYTAAQIVGQNVSMLMTAADGAAHDAHVQRFLSTRLSRVLGRGREVLARRCDGRVFPACVSIGEVPGSNPPRFVGFIQDISQRRRTEDEFRSLQERLAHTSQLATMGEMAAGIAHELNQPLAAIANYAQACDRLLTNPAADIPEIQAALREITEQAVRAGETIRRLRTLATRTPNHAVATDINALLRELGELVQREANNQDVQFRLTLATDLPTLVVHRDQIQQAVLNLIRNAVEALAGCSVQPRQIEVRTERTAQGGVEISVTDNGPGVAAGLTESLFSPFVTSKDAGVGLGLAISRTIAMRHRGTVHYRPHTPAGACFTLRLPRTA